MKIPPETFKACLAYFIIKVLKNTVISTHGGMIKTKRRPNSVTINQIKTFL